MIRGAAEHVALRLALPEPSELGTIPPLQGRDAEALRLMPVETGLHGASPWRAGKAAHAVASSAEPLMYALQQRALEARQSTQLDGPQQAQLDVQLRAVLAMTSSLEALATLSARVDRERGRWLRA